MAKENITPEERLLKIIENPETQRRKISLRFGPKTAGIKALKLWFKKPHIDKDILKSFNMRFANKFVAVLCGFFTIFWVIDYVRAGVVAQSRLKDIIKGVSVSDIAVNNIAVPQVSPEEIQAAAKTRNIFTLAPSSGPGADVTAAPVDAAGLIGTVKLVGIIWSDNPQAMVEDTKEGKTYLLNEGEQLGQVTIKKIYKDKLMISKGGQEWELR